MLGTHILYTYCKGDSRFDNTHGKQEFMLAASLELGSVVYLHTSSAEWDCKLDYIATAALEILHWKQDFPFKAQ